MSRLFPLLFLFAWVAITGRLFARTLERDGLTVRSVFPLVMMLFGVAVSVRAFRRRRRRERRRSSGTDEFGSTDQHADEFGGEFGERGRRSRGDLPPHDVPLNLECPHCAAAAKRASVSPRGDVQCGYCGAWFDAFRSG